MGSMQFLLKAFVRGQKNTNRKVTKESAKNSDCMEKGVDATDGSENPNELEIDDGSQSVCFVILFYWGLFEMLILSLVLLKSGRKNYGQQIIQNLCENDCPNYITNGLIIRLLLALYMTLGAFRSNWTLCLPWVLIDSFGFFPLTPIIISAFYKYDDFWAILYYL